MTAIADNKRRVTLRHAKPGDRFDLREIPEEGKYILTRLEPVRPVRNQVKLMRCKEGYLVAVSKRPITQEQTRAYLDEFP
jgi:hypothetical protein